MDARFKRARKAPREKVPGRLRTAVFQEAMAICPFCGLAKLGSLQVHHIDDPANNKMENLIAVCASCHDQVNKGFISRDKVHMTKRNLQSGMHPFAKKLVRAGDTVNVSGTNNSGVIAANVGRVVIQGATKAAPTRVQGSLVEFPAKYSYVEYLVKKLSEWREKGPSFGHKRASKISLQATRKILERELGGLTKDLEENRFAEVVERIQAKIDNTAMGRNNRKRGTRNYHSFEEHGQPKR